MLTGPTADQRSVAHGRPIDPRLDPGITDGAHDDPPTVLADGVFQRDPADAGPRLSRDGPSVPGKVPDRDLPMVR